MKLKNKNKGITLIALVITIIILLILAGITISQLSNNGLFDKVKLAKEKSEEAQAKEEQELAKISNKIDNISRESNSSGYKETIIWEGQGNINDVIIFKDGYTVDDFDKIKFLHGIIRSGGWDWLFPIEYSKNDWDYAMQSESTLNCIIGLPGYLDNRLTLYNITKTGFTIGQQSGPSLLRIYGITY